MEKARILIVDDEPGVRFVIERALTRDDYQVETACDGQEAIRKIECSNYDLILLDLKMEPVGGIEVLKAVRQHNPLTQVIILTAHGSIDSAVDALRMSAFDYLFKPASNDAIRARVQECLAHRQTLLRQARLASQIDNLRQTLQDLETDGTSPPVPDAINARFIRAGQLMIDLHHQSATLEGRLLSLTTTEFNILTALAQAAPQPVLARQLVNRAMGYDVEDGEAGEMMKYHIHHLRQKIETNLQKPVYIKTVRFKGYLWSG